MPERAAGSKSRPVVRLLPRSDGGGFVERADSAISVRQSSTELVVTSFWTQVGRGRKQRPLEAIGREVRFSLQQKCRKPADMGCRNGCSRDQIGRASCRER